MILALAIVLLGAVALAAPAPPADSPPPECPPLAGAPPDLAPVVRDTVGLNFTTDALDERTALVHVCLLVDSLGVVREARVTGASSPFDSAAVDAARWWWFTPARRGGRALAARVAITVAANPPRDTDPLSPDLLALAPAALARGDVQGALDAWTGALARAGVHPTIGNEWALRDRILRLAATLPAPPRVADDAVARARGAHNRMLRDLSRGTNADLAHALDGVLAESPWYADAYRWRASARAASGQRVGAIRDVLCFRLATRDSSDRVTADRALAELAAGDTLAALSLLKR